MSSTRRKGQYKVLPLPAVQRDGKKYLSAEQRAEGIALAKNLRFYPNVQDLSIEHCGDGMELRLEGPEINPQGWLRAIFWIDEPAKTIYVVDLFWKKSNRVTTADLVRINHRIRLLKVQLRQGIRPWKSRQ
jgi:phage-related protein